MSEAVVIEPVNGYINQTRLARLQEAIEAGADPGALIEPLNRAKEERDAAEEDLARASAEELIGRAELEAMVDAFGELGRQVGNASPGRLQQLYGEIGLEMVYNARERTVDVTIRPPVGLMRVSERRVAH
ncbi:hypothetical protein DMC64_38910 [Amycolatopsis sp. WAC 04197]|uniref:hypothetical protein n=1 Tax=Amycolatopsis sp. WAC 04197 TaxID=2203199 RepID=UPI000F7B60D9|nr:hypothetical protein [Amycolatopsis sp. WAC 04197]RSN39112.1 hypothetical protein DMC64_38910 [Amycolatopsis sp. WAC 04197]